MNVPSVTFVLTLFVGLMLPFSTRPLPWMYIVLPSYLPYL